ncbi:Protein tyrosine phosphatase CDC14 [Klebsormidium nitens]|uniref:protein-tyrosine-phosphatase n=1 Tax=Klebsormidium nitens TaxID=105231 RepID=A0A1Y1I320_KLENI|nr:Protein tyrosine phosphatase CDC14 [Klebsormidium nitens]|eukprot:GAQ83809.1 Protein tyrosine phosphatase CDC14 [Klebsormidium nitens]
MASRDDFANASEVVKGSVYFAVLRRAEFARCSTIASSNVLLNLESDLPHLVYEPFCDDFGPLNLGQTYRFCWKLETLRLEASRLGKKVYFWTTQEAQRKSNAAVLLGAYSVLILSKSPEEAYSSLLPFQPFLPFRDPTTGPSTYHLTVYDCLCALQKATTLGWIEFRNFDISHYEHFEQVENGDLNWIIPGKLLAFSGPQAKRTEIYGYRTLVPEDYLDYFYKTGVTGVVRLNNKVYDRRRFTDHGIAHYELFFPDGSCPSDDIVRRFLKVVETHPGALAVHCKAGLGRTGVLIGCYMMKHYRMTCNEVLGYLRIVRPGMVIGPQQHFLRDIQAAMWKLGDAIAPDLRPVTRGGLDGPAQAWSNPQAGPPATAAAAVTRRISGTRVQAPMGSPYAFGLPRRRSSIGTRGEGEGDAAALRSSSPFTSGTLRQGRPAMRSAHAASYSRRWMGGVSMQTSQATGTTTQTLLELLDKQQVRPSTVARRSSSSAKRASTFSSGQPSAYKETAAPFAGGLIEGGGSVAVATRQRRLSALASLGARATGSSQAPSTISTGQSFKIPRTASAIAASGAAAAHQSGAASRTYGFAYGSQVEAESRQSRSGELGSQPVGVVIRRTINAAGQPRKVAVPVGLVEQDRLMRRTVSQGGLRD